MKNRFFYIGFILFIIILIIASNHIENYKELDYFKDVTLENKSFGKESDKKIISRSLLSTYIFYSTNSSKINDNNLSALYSDLEYGKNSIDKSPIYEELKNIEISFTEESVTKDTSEKNSYIYTSNLKIKGESETSIKSNGVPFFVFLKVIQHDDSFLIEELSIQFLGSD